MHRNPNTERNLYLQHRCRFGCFACKSQVYVIKDYLNPNSMVMGKYSRVDGKKSSNCCSTITVVVVVSFCLVGAWMLMSSSVVPIQILESLSEETIKEVKRTNEIDSKKFEDNSVEENQEENENQNGESEMQQSKDFENRDEREEDGKSNSGVESNAEDGETETAISGKNPLRQTEAGESLDGSESKNDNSERISATGESADAMSQENLTAIQKEDNVDGNIMENQVKDKFSNEVSSAGSHSELLIDTDSQNGGAWSTQAAESRNQKKLQKSPISVYQDGDGWKICNVTAGPDYIPCLDNWHAIRRLSSTRHYEHRERHCPAEAPTCLVFLPEGYRRPIRWPESRDKIWFYNIPHTKLAEVKGHQNWVKVTGQFLAFPGGGTQFKHGALHYIDFIQKSHPDIAWGKRSRVMLDVGCGVASFGGYLFERDVLAMSFAPKDEHEAQVQFALERGIPAISAVMGTKRLPFPSSVFDVVHCARCRVPWHVEGGKLLLELDRVLRPGGYFIWSATPVYQKLPEDVGIWKAMSKLTKSMCWDLKVVSKDKLNGVAAAFYRKPTSNECYNQRAKNEPPLCKESDAPNAA
ncbi:methyltransferase PMT24 [Tripterygium wilfordii]|uniref:Methyltransferase n=1 Tax=Tripterygium wilfordii TaxID=458696 RepID=A0A7J7BUA5_TRIWF|nr:methyltransferase PMT24 [Tripterygium wilfordii]